MPQTINQEARQAAKIALSAAERAQRERFALRWAVRPGDPLREERIATLLDILAEAQAPVRSLIGRSAWETIAPTVERKLREASASVQYERRQLKKMRRRA